MDIAKESQQKMQAVVDHFHQELRTLRSNRANPAIIEGVVVEVYGTSMRLKEVAAINSPEPRQLLVSPFDPSTLHAIVKGLEKSNLNLPLLVEEGKMIRIKIPPMDANIRTTIVKQGKKKAEDAKIAIREIRRKSKEMASRDKTSGILAEDSVKKLEKVIQELTDLYCKEIDDLFALKEKEIMTI